MAPKKLSDADRNDILTRYRQPEENTVTIANSYGVSTSTISRILKQNLSEAEYELLIQQKRSGTHKPATEQVDLPGLTVPVEPAVSLVTEAVIPQRSESKPVISPPRRRQRSRSAAPDGDFSPEPPSSQLELTAAAAQIDLRDQSQTEPFGDAGDADDVPVIEKSELEEIEAELGKTLTPSPKLRTELEEEDLEEDEDLEDEDLDDELDDELDDDELDDEEDDGDEPTRRSGFSSVQIQKGGVLQVLPLSEATIPKTCYVVVDRSSELITCPLKDFADLGQIPDAETQEKTLPIFDNHRIAKRFTRRMQRVVKVPDGRMLQKVRPYLQAKGITRLLIDGRVYSL